MDLKQFGWNDFFARQYRAQAPGCGIDVPARIASACHEQFTAWAEAGEITVEPSGTLRHASRLWPAVGDWVMLREDGPVIERVLERRTTLSRKQPGRENCEQVMAANVDVLFIVSGLDHDYNPRRLERYLVLARESGARPVILLNKADLATELGLDLQQVLQSTRALAGEASVVPLSATTDASLNVLDAEMAPAETAAMVGSSGVGKSTILNRLLGSERQKTTEVRAGDHRGRHTTTARELFIMPGGWLLIDMPGLREVGLWSADEAVDDAFLDIQELAQACRFRDCTHSGEPGCAVTNSPVDEARLANYQKMRRELEFVERKTNPELARQTRAKWKAIHKAMRRDPKRAW